MTRQIALGVVLVGGLVAQGCAGEGGERQLATAEWVEAADGEPRLIYGAMLSARAEHAATHLGGDLVLLSGGVTLERAATDTAEVIDARTANRRALPDVMTTPRAAHGAVLLDDGSVLLVGGRDEGGAALASVERWDPVRGTFAQHGESLDRPRARVAVARTAGLAAFASGGSLEVWDLRTATRLRTVEGLGGPRPDGQLVVTGPGVVLYYGGGLPPQLVDLERGRSVNYPGAFHEGASLVRGVGPSVFVVGGRTRGVLAPRPQRIDLIHGGEPVRASFGLAPVDEPAVLARGTRVFVAGGLQDGLPLRRAQLFGPEGVRPFTPLAGARRSVLATGLSPLRGLFSGGYGLDGRPSALMEILTADGLKATDAFEHALLEREDLERRLAELADRRRARDRARAELERIRQEVRALQDRLARRQAETARLGGERDQAVARLSQLQQQQAQLQAQADEVGRLRGTVASLEQSIATGRQQAIGLQAQIEAAAQAAARLAASAPAPAPSSGAPAPSSGGTGSRPAITFAGPSVVISPTGVGVPLSGGLVMNRGVHWFVSGQGQIEVDLQYTSNGGRSWQTFLHDQPASGSTEKVPVHLAVPNPGMFAVRAVAGSDRFGPIASNTLGPR